MGHGLLHREQVRPRNGSKLIQADAGTPLFELVVGAALQLHRAKGLQPCLQPSAVRAVASAIAANTLAVAIPCHRVVRQDGSLSGYRWGVARKQALLDMEST